MSPLGAGACLFYHPALSEPTSCPLRFIFSFFLQVTDHLMFGWPVSAQNEDHISQPPLQLGVALSPSSGKQDVSGHDVHNSWLCPYSFTSSPPPLCNTVVRWAAIWDHANNGVTPEMPSVNVEGPEQHNTWAFGKGECTCPGPPEKQNQLNIKI